jgi:hypothetical protein
MVTYNQSGYIGESMSVRASEAYSEGKKPLSKWSKSEILDLVKVHYGIDAEKHCEDLSAEELKASFLDRSEWHHTGKFLNQTDFYAFNEEKEISTIMALTHEQKEKKNPQPKTIIEKYAFVSYCSWEGNFRNYQKKVEHCGIARWTETNGKSSKVDVSGCFGQKLLGSLCIIKKLPGKPRKNSKLWKECK